MALATSASVPYPTMTGDTMRAVLASGEVPEEWFAHLNRVMAELPFEMLQRCLDTHPAGPARDQAVDNVRRIAKHVDAEDRIEEWLAGVSERG